MTDDVMTGSGTEQITKILESFCVPGLDVKALMDSQRKNMEALAQATQVAAQGSMAVSQKQAEILRTAVQEAISMAGSLKAADPMATAKAQQQSSSRKRSRPLWQTPASWPRWSRSPIAMPIR